MACLLHWIRMGIFMIDEKLKKLLGEYQIAILTLQQQVEDLQIQLKEKVNEDESDRT